MKTTHKKNNKKNIPSICNQFLQLSNHKTALSLSLLVLITLITHWRWIFLYNYFGWGDSSFTLLFSETLKDYFSPPYLWSARMNGFGGLYVVLSSYPILFLLFGGLATFGLDTRIVAKLFYLIPVPLISAVGSYFLIKHVLKSNLAGIIGALVYSYNVYFLLSQAGTVIIAVGYALAPLVLFFLLKTLETRKIFFLILTGVIGFIESAYEFRIFYIAAWVMSLLIFFHTLFIEKVRSLWEIVKNFVYFSIPFVIVFLLNIYWILPFYKTGSIVSNVYFDRGLFGNQFMNWQQSITLFHPFWTDGRGAALFVVQSIPIYFWLIPIFALMGLILNLRNKLVIFFALVSILGILLTKQSGNPFPDLYLWLYNNFPGFSAYRESSKFYLLIALGYSILIGAFVSRLQVYKIKNKLLILGKYLMIVFIGGLFLWNSKILITGEIGGLFNPVNRPKEYEVLKNFLFADNEYSRTLWVPRFSLWSFYNNNHPRWALYNSFAWHEEFKKNPTYISHMYNTTKICCGLTWTLDLLNQGFSDNFLDSTNTKYIIVPPQYKDIFDDDMFLSTSINDRPFIINFFDNLSFLKRKDIGTKDLIVYENSNFKPLIYATEIMDSVYEVIPYKSVDYQFVSPTEYLVEIKNISKPIYLNFNNSYAEGWGLDLRGGHYLPDKDHLQTNLKFNAFYINPAEITTKYEKIFYIENIDGSINLKLRLYYRPQDLVNVGVYISLASLILIFIYLFMYLFKISEPRFKK